MSARCVDCLNEAIERCELTGAPLCAEHLWYVDDGRRVSERAAQQLRRAGRVVTEPAHYLTQLGVEFPPPVLPVPPAPTIHLLPNGADLLGWLSAALSATSLYFTWRAMAGGGVIGAFLCVVQVAIAWSARRSAGRAVHPAQARTLASFGLVVACGCTLALVALYLQRLL